MKPRRCWVETSCGPPQYTRGVIREYGYTSGIGTAIVEFPEYVTTLPVSKILLKKPTHKCLEEDKDGAMYCTAKKREDCECGVFLELSLIHI